MRKVFTFFVAVMMLGSLSFAQQNKAHRHVKHTKSESMAPAKLTMPVAKPANRGIKAAGDTINAFPWSEGFESTTATGFTFIDADNDGYNWERVTSSEDLFSVHSGDGVIVSASYDNDLGEALTPDNWMILPTFVIPTDASDFTLSWWERGQDADYASEYYSVYICTTGRTIANFTATTAVLNSTSTGEWVKKTVDLSSYAGQTINIAFRHHNITDMFFLNIDDIRIGGPEAPMVTVSGPNYVEQDVAATFTASGATTFEWYVDHDLQSETGATLTHTFTTTGEHMVVAGATNTVGTSYDTLIVNVFSCSEAITAMPWNEGFEGNTACWNFVTYDATSSGMLISDNGEGFNGSTNCLVGSYSDDSNVDQWAISPLITLPNDASNYILKYYVFLREWEGVENRYQVLVTNVSNPETSDFTLLFEETGSGDDYLPRTIPFGSHPGETIRIAFRNITPMEGDAIFFDNIYIGVPVVPDMTISGPEEVRTNESYTFTANTDVNVVEWRVDGALQSETSTTLDFTFTSEGSHFIIASATNVAGTTADTLWLSATDCPTLSLPYTPDLANDINICWDNDGWDLFEDGDQTYIYSMSNMFGFFDLDPDNWIATPWLNMPAEGSFDIAWKVMPYTPELPSDHYGVYVIQGDNATLLYQETLTASMTSPQQRVVTIPNNIAGEFKVAFRHYETTGGYVILISDIKVVESGTVGIEETDITNVSIYPNPANNVLNVEGDGIQHVEIIDINGRTVMNTTAGSINVSGLANGIYMVRIITDNGVSTRKIIKK